MPLGKSVNSYKAIAKGILKLRVNYLAPQALVIFRFRNSESIVAHS